MDFDTVEQKWQQIWEKEGVFKGKDFDSKPKFYGLIEFPYPSGVGMHVGHVKAFTSMEVISRAKRLQGYNVMFPIGWDAFGLPTENFAIKHNIPPKVVDYTQFRQVINYAAVVSAPPHSIRWWGIYQEDVSKKVKPCPCGPLACVCIFEIIVGGLL